MPSFPALELPLSDGQVSLRPYAERDIPEILIAYQDDPRLHRSLGEDRPPSGAQLGSAAERAEAEREAGTGVWLTIVEQGEDDLRGQVRVGGVDWEAGTAELKVWLAPQFRGRGLARRAFALASRWLAEGCGLSAQPPAPAPAEERR